MGLFKRKKTKPPGWYLSLEECEEKLSQIGRKKRELEHRLEILSRAKPADTVIIAEDDFSRPTSEVEWQIGRIMSELRLLDSEEELVRLEKETKERAKKERLKRLKEEREAAFSRIEVKPSGVGRDLYGEVVLSKEEASHGMDKPIKYARGSESVRIVVKIPPGVKNGARIRLKEAGLKGNPSGDLILIVKIGRQ